MVMLTGPRQVGKTTTAREVKKDHYYLIWDNIVQRRIIVSGPDAVANHINLQELKADMPLLILDEIHKYSKWKEFLKGFFDVYGKDCQVIITGSSRMNIYKKGGDSLMGRYFSYRMHPLSIRELINPGLLKKEICSPVRLDQDSLNNLLEYGGFPEPFLRSDKRFYNRWKRLRTEQFFKEDIRDLTNIVEIGRLELLAELIREYSGKMLNYSTISTHINTPLDTVLRWIAILESMYYCYTIRPWFKNIPKSLRKQPKIYLWDWSLVKDKGAKIENFLASHLLKAVHFWTDAGFGDFGLFYLRDKQKREVDFLITRDNHPFFLVESKFSETKSINPSLAYFQKQTSAPHAFQVAFAMDYVDRDCFAEKRPVRVPLITLLSQLI